MAIRDVEVLDRYGSKCVESMIPQIHLRSGEHLVRSNEERLTKQHVYGQLDDDRRPAPKKKFIDYIGIALTQARISQNS